MFNLGAEWDTSWLPGLTLRAVAIHTGAQYADDANTQKLPTWTRVDLGARYVTQLATHNVAIRASVENAFHVASGIVIVAQLSYNIDSIGG
ncbi:TonB-dependent receptor [Salmonella enterica]|nr:TonB-dependent receptor [Salmonella enterica]